ncbi:dual specificity protein kinase YAK1 [Pycnococcus provasolii]
MSSSLLHEASMPRIQIRVDADASNNNAKHLPPSSAAGSVSAASAGVLGASALGAQGVVGRQSDPPPPSSGSASLEIKGRHGAGGGGVVGGGGGGASLMLGAGGGGADNRHRPQSSSASALQSGGMQVSSSTGKFVNAALQPRRFKRYHDNAEDDNNDNDNDNNNNNNDDDDDDDGLTQDEKMERETRRRRRDGSTSQGTPLFTAVHASTTNSRDAANRPARLTTQHLVNFYQRCNPSGFHYNSAFNPRRLLTKNGRACLNHGYDNEHNDLILYVNMALEPTNARGTGGGGAAAAAAAAAAATTAPLPPPASSGTAAAAAAATAAHLPPPPPASEANNAPPSGDPSSRPPRRYTVTDMLGSGTFGQVVRCTDSETGKTVAVKVIKNQPAYYHQARVEISIVQMLNTRYDPNGERPIVRMMDYFVFQKHLCLVFEELSVNLYELIRHNGFKGLSLNLVRVFLNQILQALQTLRQARVVHCDLKPENILLRRLDTSGDVKLIDFGSACFTNKTVYSYVQSRFYRSPEVITCSSYDCAIDMWSLGCVAAELFLGLPLFPGASEYNLLCRIVETLGMPSNTQLAQGKETWKFFYHKNAAANVTASAAAAAAAPAAPPPPPPPVPPPRHSCGIGGDVVVIGDGFVTAAPGGAAAADASQPRTTTRGPHGLSVGAGGTAGAAAAAVVAAVAATSAAAAAAPASAARAGAGGGGAAAAAPAPATATTTSSTSRRAYLPSLPPQGPGSLPPHPPPPLHNPSSWAYTSATCSYVLMSQREYEACHGSSVAVGKRYFPCMNLAGIVAQYPHEGRTDNVPSEVKAQRACFLDFLLGLLALDPRDRWTPEQALAHPFITGAPFPAPATPTQRED